MSQNLDQSARENMKRLRKFSFYFRKFSLGNLCVYKNPLFTKLIIPVF